MRHILGNRRAVLIFLAPALVIYIGVIVVPSVWSLVYSFFQGTPALGFSFVGVTNFKHLWTDPTVGHRCCSPSSTRSCCSSARSCSATCWRCSTCSC